MRPLVSLSSVAIALILTLAGLPQFLNEGTRLDPTFASAALATVAAVLILTYVQLTGLLYRTTLHQLIAQRDLIRFARRDPLTGIDNRLALRERFEALAPGSGRLIALLLIDLDGFKPINDEHGHQAGDAILRQVATRLTACLRPGDGAFRIGGDEFAVLLSPVRQRSEATAMARRLVGSLSEPYAVEGEAVRVSASIGVAFGDEGDADLDVLAAAADAALYDAKRSGCCTFRFARDAATMHLI
jgi:diguanylate cyclase (GGDEF)-like protein